MPDYQSLFNFVAAAGLAGLGWFARVLWEANKELRSDMTALREKIPETYTRKDDFQNSWREVMDLLREINNKLDRKADK